MLRFQYTSHLFALVVIPIIILLFILVILWRKRKLKSIGDTDLVNNQVLGYIPGRNTLKLILMCVGISAIIVGWANLQMGAKAERVERKGVDVIVAMDVSKSMLAKDIEPDRLSRAKQLVMRMMDKMQNDRIGLIIFAGRAYLQVPLTIDYGAMKMMLQTINPNVVPMQGTVIGDAIDLSLQSFSQKEKKYKSLVVISDGEDHDDKALAKAKEAAESGIIVHTVGIGSPQGSTIYDPSTNAVKLDENGHPVVSKLNESELRKIATAGRGTYTILRNTDDVASKLVNEINGMEQKSLGAVVFTDYKNYFQYFLIAGFILLIIEWILPGAKMKTGKA